jgi:hypothetical protein
MQYLHDAVSVLMAVFLASKGLQWLNRNAKRARVENQLHVFIRQCLGRESGSGTEHFKETKDMLMSDWLETNPKCTRIDFCRYFDCLIDGHCESFAIVEYLKRRELAASNDGLVRPPAEETRQSA